MVSAGLKGLGIESDSSVPMQHHYIGTLVCTYGLRGYHKYKNAWVQKIERTSGDYLVSASYKGFCFRRDILLGRLQ